MSTQMFVIEIGWRYYAVPIGKIDSVLNTLSSLREVKINEDYRAHHFTPEALPVITECKLSRVFDNDPTPAKPETEEEGA